MKTNTIRDRLLASTMIGGVAIAAAVALPAAAVLLAPATASAQDYTTGALSGTVSDQQGNPISGASVTIRSNEQGLTRSFTTGANGTFRASLIPPGTYEVTVNAEGYDALVEPSVNVAINSNNSYVFTVGATGGAADGTDLGDVVVVGVRPELDFSQNATGLTVNVDELVERVPLGRSVTSVALLAPRAIEGDSAFGNQPSLGGSSVAENAFYINGLNVTDFNTYVGAAQLPFDFYRTVDVQTGGYSAEFGRATGGIINAVTKSGTNEWIFELHGNWNPDELREDSPIIFNRASISPNPLPEVTNIALPTYNPFTRNTASPANRPDLTEVDSYSIIAEAGGPIIRDRLYAYGLYQWSESDSLTVNNLGNQNTQVVNDIPVWGAKVDVYITDTQRLEGTYWSTEGEFDTVVTNRATGAPISRQTSEVGGTNYVVRYTGNWTDWLTLSAAYGVSEQQNNLFPQDALTLANAEDRRTNSPFRIAGSNVFATFQEQTTEREFYRADADITFSAFGDHHVRMGIDNEETTLSRASSRTGGFNLDYYTRAQVGAGIANTTIVSATIGEFGSGGAPISGTNEAWYIQDSWDINDNLNIQIGLRHDSFALSNLTGEEVIELKDNYGPRVGFNLDPIGDGVDKFYGSYGRYFIPIASNLSFRGADLFYQAYFQGPALGAPAYNADGTPIGGFGAPVISNDFNICPAGSPGGSAGLRACEIAGDGSVEPADAKYAFGTKATNEDEFIVGYERQLSDLWSVGAAVTYRKLNNVSEDIDVGYLVERYCTAQGIAGCSDDPLRPTQIVNYIIANPGKDLSFLVQQPLPNGTRPVLNFTAAEVGIGEATREYAGLEVTFDREYDGVWSLSGSYVISESIGNYEGTVLSDNGQVDAGSTILYDHIGLTEGRYGLLPNHRGHQFKLFGAYTLWDSLTVGANFSVISPRAFGCISRTDTDQDAFAYGAGAGVCRPDIRALAGNRDPFFQYVPFGQGTAALVDTSPEYEAYAVTSNRGEAMESDWIYNLDMSFRYTMPTFGFMPEGITLRADVFNVFNDLGVTDITETGTTGNGTAGNANYGLPAGYQTPRSVRFGFDLRF